MNPQNATSPDESFNQLIDLLGERCDNVGLEWETKEFGEDSQKYVVVKIPCGRDSRQVGFPDAVSLQAFLDVEFEKYKGLGKYQAIWSSEDGTIECVLRLIRPQGLNLVRRKLLGEAPFDDEADGFQGSLTIEGGPGGCTIQLCATSKELAAFNYGIQTSRRIPSMRISGLVVRQHDDALSILEKLANSLFFQIDLTRDVSLGLLPFRRFPNRPFWRRKVENDRELEFPSVEFDGSPMSLYWYARSASGMPLLQYLAYYQVVEFYMPVFFRAEAGRHVRAIVKAPDFRPERESDIGKIFGALKGLGIGAADERSQLKATLRECVDAEGVREFIEEHEERVAFLSSKTPGLTDIKIPVGSEGADLRDLVADRIYQIRCAIVHTKNEGSEKARSLFPFSKEAELLFHDIELMEFLARRVLIAASAPLAI